MSLRARPKRRPQESRPPPSAMGSTAKRWPSRTVYSTVNSEPLWDTRVPASSLRVAMATLSPSAGRRPTSWRSHTRSFTVVPPLAFQTYVLVRSVSQRALRLGMVTGRTRARGCLRSGGAAVRKASVVDAGHVLGPLAGGEASVFIAPCGKGARGRLAFAQRARRARHRVQDLSSRRTRIEARMVEVAVV